MSPKYFLVSIDTEEDQWASYHDAPTVRNIAILPRFQRLCDEFGVKPSYLINYPVATQASSKAVISQLAAESACEIGMHCHPWNTPPVDEEVNARNTMLNNLPRALVSAKLQSVQAAIEAAAGYAPRSFRAGRWGMSEDTCRELESLGFTVESSITPHTDWSQLHGPDYSRQEMEAFRFNPPRFRVPDSEGTMAEIPPSIGYLKTPTSVSRRVARLVSNPLLGRLRVRGAIHRLLLGRRFWLSPETSSRAEMETLATSLLDQGQPYLHMMFHSTSLHPGLSPYTPDADSVEELFGRIKAIFALAVDRGLEAKTLQEMGNIVLSNGHSPS